MEDQSITEQQPVEELGNRRSPAHLDKWKKVATLAVFVVLFFAILTYVGYVLTPKDNGDEDGVIAKNCMSVFAEPEDSLDAVLLGDSIASESVDPMWMWKRSGMASYVCAYNGQRSYCSVSLLRKVLEAQHDVKIVVLEPSVLYNDDQPQYVLYQILDDLLPVAHYHHRWKDVTFEDFYSEIKYTHLSPTKGYVMREHITHADTSDYMEATDECRYPGKVSEFCLSQIQAMCQERGIRLVVVAIPSVGEWSTEKHNAIEDICNQCGIDFYDMNTDDSVGIDWSSDTRDGGTHLNWKGSAKASRYLLDVIQRECPELVDHRGDPAYTDSWDDLLDEYEDLLAQTRNGHRVM